MKRAFSGCQGAGNADFRDVAMQGLFGIERGTLRWIRFPGETFAVPRSQLISCTVPVMDKQSFQGLVTARLLWISPLDLPPRSSAFTLGISESPSRKPALRIS